MSGGDRRAVVRSAPSSSSDPDPETPSAAATAAAMAVAPPRTPTSARRSGVGDVLRHLDRGSSNRGLVRRHMDRGGSPVPVVDRSTDDLGDGAPPEWALLLIGCLLGLATGICVAAFNRGVHVIHEWAWAGTPNEGAAWLRLQRLADTWHRILQIPVTGGVVVGMMHGLLEIFEQIKQSRSTRRDGLIFLREFSKDLTALTEILLMKPGGNFNMSYWCAVPNKTIWSSLDVALFFF